MKKIIPVFIVVFVFGFVITAGFLIVKTAISSDTSNAKLIEAYIDDTSAVSSTSMMAFTHLANAESDMVAEPASRETITAGYLEPLPMPVVIAPVALTPTASSTDTASSSDTSVASSTASSTDQPSQDIATTQELSQ